jgi:hypothetical protein
VKPISMGLTTPFSLNLSMSSLRNESWSWGSLGHDILLANGRHLRDEWRRGNIVGLFSDQNPNKFAYGLSYARPKTCRLLSWPNDSTLWLKYMHSTIIKSGLQSRSPSEQVGLRPELRCAKNANNPEILHKNIFKQEKPNAGEYSTKILPKLCILALQCLMTTNQMTTVLCSLRP